MYKKKYSELFLREPDFLVSYSYIDKQNNGYDVKLFQGIRCDFCYKDDYDEYQIKPSSSLQLYMIYPEFLDFLGKEILYQDVNNLGFAYMWIMSDSLRIYHKNRLNVGTLGYMMTGIIPIASVEVVKLIGLADL